MNKYRSCGCPEYFQGYQDQELCCEAAYLNQDDKRCQHCGCPEYVMLQDGVPCCEVAYLLQDNRRAAVLELIKAETALLKAFGWVEMRADTWKPPEPFTGRTEYRKGHAVNALKQSIYSPGSEYRNLVKESET